MDIKTVALILLLGRFVSAAFIFLVLKRQRELFKFPIAPELAPFRRRLFYLSSAVFLGNITAMVLDILTIMTANSLQREDTPSLINVTYVFSNCITSIVSAYLIWSLYRTAAQQLEKTDKTEHELQDENTELRREKS